MAAVEEHDVRVITETGTAGIVFDRRARAIRTCCSCTGGAVIAVSSPRSSIISHARTGSSASGEGSAHGSTDRRWLRCRCAGARTDSAGAGDPHLLFLHGWCGDRSFFAPQFDHFSRSHRVVSVDLPGHGESRAPATYTIDGLAADVAALGRELGLGRGALVSHSLGAMVSLALAQQAPELVSSVIMVDPPPLSKEVWKDFAGSLLPGFEGPDPSGRPPELRGADVPADR